jgi:hypothetical protein
MRRWDKRNDEDNAEEKKINYKKLLNLIKGMKNVNKYIKYIQYKLERISAGHLKYNLLHIFYALKNQYHSDMVQIIRLYNPFEHEHEYEYECF